METGKGMETVREDYSGEVRASAAELEREAGFLRTVRYDETGAAFPYALSEIPDGVLEELRPEYGRSLEDVRYRVETRGVNVADVLEAVDSWEDYVRSSVLEVRFSAALGNGRVIVDSVTFVTGTGGPEQRVTFTLQDGRGYCEAWGWFREGYARAEFSAPGHPLELEALAVAHQLEREELWK